MADDTRQSNAQAANREALNDDPNNTAFSGSQWDDKQKKTYQPPENANLMAGGTEHTAGGKVPEVTFWNALHHGQPITEIHKRPCVRDSFMTGMGAGVATGAIRIIWRAPVMKACNWAVGTFVLGSGVMYQYCLHRRQAEKEGMTRAMEILNRKEVEKRARDQRKEQLREERRAQKDKEQDEKLAAMKREAEGNGKSWWKVW